VRGTVADDPLHLTIAQAGTALDAELTCNGDMPLGTGTYDGLDFTLTFDLGGGDAVVLTGTPAGWGIAGDFTAPGDSGDFWLERTTIELDCAFACDPVAPVRFVGTDFTELDKIEEISLFRSAAGHDYSDLCESCRSMKHYYAPFLEFRDNGLVAVYSPVDGTVVSVTAEGHGDSLGGENKQVRIRSSLHPEYTFILFHVDLLANPVEPGDAVVAGEQVGTGRLHYPDLAEYAHDFDVAVRLHTLFGDRYVSFFDVMTDALFATYVARGASSRSDFVLTKAARDADPLTCLDEEFTSVGSLPLWFVLDAP